MEPSEHSREDAIQGRESPPPKRRSRPFDPAKFLQRLSAGRTAGHYPRQSDIFVQGRPADAVFYIQKGRVKLSVVSETGKEIIISMVDAGDFFGVEAIAGQPLRQASATTLSDCSLLRIEKRSILGALRDHLEFSQFFVMYLLARNVRYEEAMIHRMFDSSEKRLARILLLLARIGKDGRQEVIVPKITQETLAQMVGTTRARVNTFLTKFRKLGLIEYDGGLKVHSSLLDVVLHE